MSDEPQPPASEQSTGLTNDPTQDQQVKALEMLARALGAPGVAAIIIPLVVSLGGTSMLLTALGGAEAEDVDENRARIVAMELKLIELQHDVSALKRNAGQVGDMRRDLSLLANDVKHMAGKVSDLADELRP